MTLRHGSRHPVLLWGIRPGRIPLAAWLGILLINGIVLWNAFTHDGDASYDSTAHHRYARILSEGRLPTRGETKEFFSPPLGYVPSAVLQRAGMSVKQADKAWQFLNVAYSVALTWLLVRIYLMLPGAPPRLSWLPLLLVGMFPVYYKTFAMPRSEPLLALIGMAALALSLRLMLKEMPRWWEFATLGLLCGLLILSRQWGFFLLPGIWFPLGVRLWASRRRPGREITSCAIAGAIFLAAGGWFYGHLYANYGTITAFNKNNRGLSARRVLGELQSIGQLPDVFSKPVRPALGGEAFPILYADVWGDYWGYFLFAAYDKKSGMIKRLSRVIESAPLKTPGPDTLAEIEPMWRYACRVNAVALAPAILCAAALLAAVFFVVKSVWTQPAREAPYYAAVLLMFFGTAAGYLWFQAGNGDEKGDTVKAAYILQVFPVTALIAAWMGARLFQRSQRIFWVITAVILLSALHNSGAFISRVAAGGQASADLKK